MKENKYGYKVCYREIGKTKLKIHLICNTLEGAKWNIQYFESHKTIDRKTKKEINNVDWLIIPIKNKFQYKWLWKGCPF